MNTPESLNSMGFELIRRGLPADYAERAAAEFADHHRDLVEELQAAGFSESQAITEASHRLGDSRKLAKKTVREYQMRFWCARWPLITFLLAPIPAYIATYVVVALSLCLTMYGLINLGVTTTTDADAAFLAVPVAVKYAVLVSFTLMLPSIVLYGFSRLARRAALGAHWVLIAACVLGLFIGTFRWERIGPNSKLTMRDWHTGEVLKQPQRPDFVIMLPLGAEKFWTWRGVWSWYASPLQLGQLLLPAAAATAFAIRRRQLGLRAERIAVAAC
jgi:hypothetical protein